MNIPKGRPWDLIFILILTAFLFLPTLSQSFVSWDDEGHLTENLQVHSLSLENIKGIFRSDVNRTYIPLTILSFAFEYRFFGYNPFIYHLDNLLLHLGVIALLYFLTLRLGFSSNAATFAALLFGVHPMHVESVAWVTQRKDVLYSLFYLLALWRYVVYVQDKKITAYLWALVFAALSILAKPMAISLPLILCLLDWFLRRRLSLRLTFEKLPFMLTVFSFAWVTYAMNMRVIDAKLPESLLIWIWCAVFYLGKFLAPAELLVLYQLPQPITLNNLEYLSAVGLLSGLILLLICFRRNRTFLFAIGYFLMSIFFLLRFDNKQDLTIVADRFMYLPSVGICIFFGWGIHYLLQWAGDKHREIKRFIFGMTMIGLSLLGMITYGRARSWGNEQLLWEQVARRYQSGLAYSQLGNYFLKKGQFSEALKNYQAAIERTPSYSKPYSNRGILMLKLGRYQEAISDFDRAIQLESKEPAILFNNRGYAYMLLGRDSDALADYDHAIEVDRKYVPAYLNRATLYKDQKKYGEAMTDLNEVLRIDAANTMAQANINFLRKIMGNAQVQ